MNAVSQLFILKPSSYEQLNISYGSCKYALEQLLYFSAMMTILSPKTGDELTLNAHKHTHRHTQTMKILYNKVHHFVAHNFCK